MDFVTHLQRILCKDDALWVIVDWLTKLAHFIAVRMTFTLKESTGCIFERLSNYMEY